MEKLKELKTLLEQQVNQITDKGDITPQDLEMLDKAVDVIKDIETICAMRKAEEEEGYSQAMRGSGGYGYSGTWYDPAYQGRQGQNYYTNGGTRTDGMSYRGGNSYGRNYRRMYSRDEAKDNMLDKLEELMDEATTEKERTAIRRCMEKIEA